MSDYKYIVFRTYSPDEEEFEIGPVYYGWSESKKIVKAFLAQRGENKYGYKKMSNEDIEFQSFANDISKNDDTMIKLLMLPSVADQQKYPLFITDKESKWVEKQIHLYFSELSSFERYPKYRERLIEMYQLLKDECRDVLENIGFIPKELNDMGYMESECMFTNLENEIDYIIEEAYNLESVEPTADDNRTPKGQLHLTDIHSKICYSLECFIKMLRNEF